MSRRRWVLTLYVCGMALFAAGCMTGKGGAAGNGPLTLTVLQTGRQCAASGNNWRGTWIDSPEAFRKWMAACRSNIVEFRRDNVPDVDFSRFGVLAVEMGWRSSAGYGFDETGVKGYMVGGVVTVVVDCYKPDPGAMTAQVLTSPWILIQMPLTGYDNIRVVDKDARLLIKIGRF